MARPSLHGRTCSVPRNRTHPAIPRNAGFCFGCCCCCCCCCSGCRPAAGTTASAGAGRSPADSPTHPILAAVTAFPALVPLDAPLLVGYSGGLDSTVLLHWL